MKKLLLTLAASVITSAASAQAIDPLANTLALYDFNGLTYFQAPNVPTYCAPCLTVTDLTICNLSQSLHLSGGPDNSKFRCFAGWDKTYDYSFARTDLSQASNTLSFDVAVVPGNTIGISGLSLDWARPSVGSVDSIQAAIFWQDSSGAIQYRSSDAMSLVGTGAWNSLDFAFTNGSSAFPTGIAGDGESYHVELYAWGQDGGVLYLDNIALEGQCAPIPEPGGALLIGAAGLLVLMRRRTRRR